MIGEMEKVKTLGGWSFKHVNAVRKSPPGNWDKSQEETNKPLFSRQKF